MMFVCNGTCAAPFNLHLLGFLVHSEHLTMIVMVVMVVIVMVVIVMVRLRV